MSKIREFLKSGNPDYIAFQAAKERDQQQKDLLSRHDELYEKYKGTEFEGYFDNPWRSLADSVYSPFGIRRNKAIENMMLSDSDAIKKVTDLKYASPLSEVGRNAQAGLNSDLLGVSGQMPSESPSESSRGSVTDSPVNDISGVAQALLSITATAMSIPEGIQGLVSNSLDNAMSFEELVNAHLGDFPELAPSEGNPVENLLKSVYLTGDRIPKLAESLFPSSKRLQRQFEMSFRQNYNTAAGKLARGENARSLLELANDPMFDDEYRGILFQMSKIGVQLQLKHLEIETKYKELEQKLQSEHEGDLYENMEKEVESVGDVYDTQKTLNSAARTHARLQQSIDSNTNGAEVGQAITAENIAERKQAEITAADMDAIKEFESYLDSLNGTPREFRDAVSDKGTFKSWQDYRRYKRAKRRNERNSSSGIGSTIVKALIK